MAKLIPAASYYCKDAFDALKALEDPEKDPKTASVQSQTDTSAPIKATAGNRITHQNLQKGSRKLHFWEPKLSARSRLDELFSLINRSALFRISWGAANAKGEKWEKYEHDFSERLKAMRKVLDEKAWLQRVCLVRLLPLPIRKG